MSYLLDADIVISFLNGRPEAIELVDQRATCLARRRRTRLDRLEPALQALAKGYDLLFCRRRNAHS